MRTHQPENPEIRFVEQDGETTLLIDGAQAMQGWEQELMQESADILCGYGSQFLEVGLGFGMSALRIAGKPTTRRHVVVEKYQPVIDAFRAAHPSLPAALEIVCADFLDHMRELEPGELDGMFFDPWLPHTMRSDAELWDEITPLLVRSLRIGGVLMPCFSTRPVMCWPFVHYFDRIIVERRTFEAYPTTSYTYATTGDAFIQCFVRTR